MNICVFEKYQVKYTNHYSFISDYNDCDPNGPIYTKDKYEFNKKLDGDSLIDIITKELQDSLTIDVNFQDNFIFIEKFNPDNGTDSNIEIKFDLIKEKN